jgi:hypothetical protein
MNMMHNFSRALAACMEGPPRRSQNDLADTAGVNRSKICRLLQNRISCDRDDLDRILNAVPEAKLRRELVMAYLRDMASPGALLHIRTDGKGLWEGFDFQPLSAKGRAALQSILTGPDRNVRAFEKMIMGMAEALAV